METVRKTRIPGARKKVYPVSPFPRESGPFFKDIFSRSGKDMKTPARAIPRKTPMSRVSAAILL